ncbi:hypothetical protein [Planktothrix agardhii]|nr:hypothetical protein [Planktothrix agardhii]
MIWAFIYSNLIGNSIGLNICGMWGVMFGRGSDRRNMAKRGKKEGR